jgi:hypothetical protein
MSTAHCKVQIIAQRVTPERQPLIARPYSSRVPDGEYLALCTHVYYDQRSRNYGERIYLYFQIFDGEFQGKTVRMFLRPSVFPTSNFYRAWAIAHGGPPRSRNTKMSARIFKGKLFRLLTTTVKPKHRVTGEDGKVRPGPFLPEAFWYSKVACVLALEVTNEKIAQTPDLNTNEEGGLRPPAPPVVVTDFSSKPFSGSGFPQGKVGRRELGDGSKRDCGFAVRDGKTVTTLHDQPAGKGTSLPAPSPQFLMPREPYAKRRAELERQKEILRKRGLL